MRALASVQKILEVEDIPNADAIQRAKVLGWHVVIKKGEYKPGDLCIYVEIDSILPQRPEFEFLAKSKFRIKTVRLRGQVSQGICFPVSIVPGYVSLTAQKDGFFMNIIKPNADGSYGELHFIHEVGDDVTATLGITQWEPPIAACLKGTCKGLFPSFIPKTDETRIQNVPGVITRHLDTKFWITEKIDGTSATYFAKKRAVEGPDGREDDIVQFGYCSRNIEFKPVMDTTEPQNVYWDMAKKYRIDEKLIAWAAVENQELCIQGEIAGPGIQGNPLKLKELTFFLFNVFDINAHEYWAPDKASRWAAMANLPHVPILAQGLELRVLGDSVDKLVAYATRKSILSPEEWLEGLVFRPEVSMTDEDLGRLSFKVINPEFLLKHGG